ncbi:MAG: hypothetical protein KF851_10225 [Pirellulaceae bacterium]|nr:hypothetical protein [Pirellulaceae bacterium]
MARESCGEQAWVASGLRTRSYQLWGTLTFWKKLGGGDRRITTVEHSKSILNVLELDPHPHFIWCFGRLDGMMKPAFGGAMDQMA